MKLKQTVKTEEVIEIDIELPAYRKDLTGSFPTYYKIISEEISVMVVNGSQPFVPKVTMIPTGTWLREISKAEECSAHEFLGAYSAVLAFIDKKVWQPATPEFKNDRNNLETSHY